MATPTSSTGGIHTTDPADEAGGEVIYSSDGLDPVPVTKPPVSTTTSTANNKKDTNKDDNKDNSSNALLLESKNNYITNDQDDTYNDYITPQMAFEMFQGKVYSVQTHAKTTPIMEPQQQPQSQKETPLERLARLQKEVVELEQAFQLQHNVSQTSSGRDFDEQLLQLALSLKSRLDTLKSTSQNTNIYNHDELTRLIQQQLVTLSKGSDKDKQSTSTTTGLPDTGVVYELYGTTASLGNNNVPTTTMEERLVKLERLLGSNQNNPTSSSPSYSSPTGSTSSSSFPNNKSLIHRLEELESLIQTVDPTTLEHTMTKAKVIRADLEAASKARNKLTATYKKEDSKMIQQLHQQMIDLEGLSQYLPALVERLQQLAHTHVQASSFASRLSACELSANQLSAHLVNLEQSMDQLQSNLVDNLNVLQGNLKTLDERLNQLE